MAFGIDAFGAVGFGGVGSGSTRTPFQHYRTTGSDPPPSLAFGELGWVDGTDTILMGKGDGSQAVFRDAAHNDAAYQPIDADLTAVAGLSSAGLVARTGSGSAAARTLTGTTNQVTVTNGDGVAGNPTISLPSTLVLPNGTTATTQSAGDASTKVATTAYADTAAGARAPSDIISVLTGTGNNSSDQSRASTSYGRLNSQIGGVDGIQWTNSTGRTVKVLVLIQCTISSDGTRQSFFRIGYSGSGVSATVRGTVRTLVGNYIPVTLAAVIQVTSGSTATLYVEAASSTGGTAYLVEAGDATWTLVGIPIG